MAPSEIPLASVLNKLMWSHSTSALSSVRPEHDCYEPETSLLLVFNTRQYDPLIKEKIANLWKALQFRVQRNTNCLRIGKVSKEPSKPGETIAEEFDEDVEELSPEVKQEDDGVRKLFEKMLELRMDKHALAIADGYRTRPQVCTCKEDCCSCFDYTQFLHNLRLHERKDLLRRVYARSIKRKDPSKHPNSESTHDYKTDSQSKGLLCRENANDEFSMKMEDSEEDSDDDLIKTAVINRIRNEICSSVKQQPQKEISAKNTKNPKTHLSQKVTRRPWLKRVAPQPPYETKFNSVHRRVREFDPDSYKILVREEIKQLSEMPALERKLRENRVTDPAERPPWKM